MRNILFVFCFLGMLTAKAQKPMLGGSTFVVQPYLQIGANPSAKSLHVLWQTNDEPSTWSIEYRPVNGKKWEAANQPTFTLVAVAGFTKRKTYNAELTNLNSGGEFEYRMNKNGKPVFTAVAKAPKTFDQPYRFAAFGDVGAGTKEAKQMANSIYNAKPDLVVIPGDIVYEYGLISEYETKFWPIYNADKVDTIGVPLLRSVPVIASVGNHDADSRDLDKYPDALAYYQFWDQPLNGPLGKEGGAFVPLLKGSDSNRNAFLHAAGERYPRMTNFSYNYGNAHWLVLDADTYVDWTDSLLLDWVKKDLAAASTATWRFVVYHHPGFNSSREHYEQQQMRLLAPLFDAAKVDIVFNGHVHNYQRSFPMQFVPDKKGTLLVGGKDNKNIRGRVVNGRWILDKSFDGNKNKKPNGVIYIVTGAGGQKLYNPEQHDDPDSWQKFTDKFISKVHTISVVDVTGSTLKLSQVDANGTEVDAFTIQK